jgi:septal ring factor EnvC (AmiA/AmiB activator)
MDRKELAQRLEAQEYLKEKLQKKISKLETEKRQWEKYLTSEYGHLHTPLGLNPNEAMHFSREKIKYDAVCGALKRLKEEYARESGDVEEIEIIADAAIRSIGHYV